MMQPSFAPIATLQECSSSEVNALLVEWDHKMGPLRRGETGYAKPGCYVLLHEARRQRLGITSVEASA